MRVLRLSFEFSESEASAETNRPKGKSRGMMNRVPAGRTKAVLIEQQNIERHRTKFRPVAFGF